MRGNIQKSLAILIAFHSFLSPNLFGEEKTPEVEDDSWLLKRESPGKKPKAPSNFFIPFTYDGENIIIMFDGTESIVVELTTSEGISIVCEILDLMSLK